MHVKFEFYSFWNIVSLTTEISVDLILFSEWLNMNNNYFYLFFVSVRQIFL